MKDMLKGKKPDIDIGKYCSNPYVCDFHCHCWQHMTEDLIFTLRDRGQKFAIMNIWLMHTAI
ncbi:MAG: hypothetical protein SWO11_21370 [Thermodesulfobacteriota bacterium]|nr:hypothetical protein [Thermodesulfobacteriota bacterium]